jgi:hypothetical protein
MPRLSKKKSRPSSKKPAKMASSAAKSRRSSAKASARNNGEIDSEKTELRNAPDWVKKRFELSRTALRKVAAKRGKHLKVYPGLDMEGV